MSAREGRPATVRPSMVELARPILTVGLSLSPEIRFDSEESLRAALTGHLQNLEKAASSSGLAAADISALQRPLVAFLDEIILNSKWEHGQRWSRDPLGLKYCGVLHLGAIFFDDIARLRRLGDAGRELLEVYFLCLLLGFEGQYRTVDPARLRVLRQELTRELGYSQALSKDMRLSPKAGRGAGIGSWRRPQIVKWRLIAICGAAALMMLTAFHLWLADIASRIR